MGERGGKGIGPKQADQLIREVRACFNRLKSVADSLHADIEVTAAMRAVLETLHEDGEQTVPQVARSKSVSRQHIQVLVNDLAAAGMVRTRANPRDKRSPLVGLTSQGRETFGRIRERETGSLAALGTALAACDVDAALATLAALRAFLDSKLQLGGTDDESS